jgi:hypothetical protein
VLGEENAYSVAALGEPLLDLARDVDHLLAVVGSNGNSLHMSILSQKKKNRGRYNSRF